MRDLGQAFFRDHFVVSLHEPHLATFPVEVLDVNGHVIRARGRQLFHIVFVAKMCNIGLFSPGLRALRICTSSGNMGFVWSAPEDDLAVQQTHCPSVRQSQVSSAMEKWSQSSVSFYCIDLPKQRLPFSCKPQHIFLFISKGLLKD